MSDIKIKKSSNVLLSEQIFLLNFIYEGISPSLAKRAPYIAHPFYKANDTTDSTYKDMSSNDLLHLYQQ